MDRWDEATARKFKQLTVDVNALCQSAGKNIFLNTFELCRDYKQVNGDDLGAIVQSYGFNTVKDFLYYLDGDVVKLFRDDEGRLRVQAVVTQATAHLHELISRQSNKHNKNKRAGRLVGGTATRRHIPLRRPPMRPTPATPARVLPRESPPPPAVPRIVQESLVSSSVSPGTPDGAGPGLFAPLPGPVGRGRGRGRISIQQPIGGPAAQVSSMENSFAHPISPVMKKPGSLRSDLLLISFEDSDDDSPEEPPQHSPLPQVAATGDACCLPSKVQWQQPVLAFAPECGSYMPVNVTHVDSPGCFYVQMTEFKAHLGHMMDALDAWYKSPRGNDYTVPNIGCLIPGLPIALCFESHWHRALVLEQDPDSVDVIYVDYGTRRHQVAPEECRLLSEEFLQLPFQMLKAAFACIKPPGEDWTLDAQVEMLRMVSGGLDLQAIEIVARGCFEPAAGAVLPDGMLLMELCDVRTDEDVYIHAELVRKGLAVTAEISCEAPSAPPDFFGPPTSHSYLDDLMGLDTLSISSEPPENQPSPPPGFSPQVHHQLQQQDPELTQLIDQIRGGVVDAKQEYARLRTQKSSLVMELVDGEVQDNIDVVLEQIKEANARMQLFKQAKGQMEQDGDFLALE